MSARAKIVRDQEGRLYGIRWNCPGCALRGESGAHVLPVRWLPAGDTESPHAAGKAHWGFNGDFERPTFTPSVLTTVGCFVCHSFVTDGRIQFLADSTHALAGQTVELPELQELE